MTRCSLEGQRALVTGASSGIGRGIAVAMGRAGAAVAVNYRGDEEGAAAVVAEITGDGGEAYAVRADVAREDQVEAMFADVIGRLRAIDILVNNAGIQKDVPFHEMPLDYWRAVIDVNLTGQYLCARAAVREFLRRGARPEVSRAAGKIICISSVHEAIPWACRVNYAASKGGVEMMMKSLAQEVADRKIRVNSIAPGAVRTPINRDVWETPQAEAALLKLVPYGRIGEVEDVARAAVWLASDEADYITGTSLYVDGGMMLYPGFLGNGWASRNRGPWRNRLSARWRLRGDRWLPRCSARLDVGRCGLVLPAPVRRRSGVLQDARCGSWRLSFPMPGRTVLDQPRPSRGHEHPADPLLDPPGRHRRNGLHAGRPKARRWNARLCRPQRPGVAHTHSRRRARHRAHAHPLSPVGRVRPPAGGDPQRTGQPEDRGWRLPLPRRLAVRSRGRRRERRFRHAGGAGPRAGADARTHEIASGRSGGPALRGDAGVLAGMDRLLPIRGTVRGGRSPKRAGAQAPHLCAVWRERCRADDLAARANRRLPQLGLPVLLAARRGLRAVCPLGTRIWRRGTAVQRLPTARVRGTRS